MNEEKSVEGKKAHKVSDFKEYEANKTEIE